MQFGLMTEPQLGMTYEELLAAAKFAEEAGLDSFARSDHYLFPGTDAPHATDALATLAGLARETSRIDLCVLVAPITFRHPAVLAKMAATIDEMSGGRLVLGVGTGWMEEEHETFGLASQLRRSTVSIAANVAEGYKRSGRSEKARFLNIAQGSLEETRYYLILTNDLGYTDTRPLTSTLDEVGRLLGGYLRALKGPPPAP